MKIEIELLKIGDIGFIKSGGLVSWLIRKVTCGKVNHCFIIVNPKNGMLIHATFSGVKKDFIQNLKVKELYIKRLNSDYHQNADFKELIKYLYRRVGQKYDTWALFGILKLYTIRCLNKSTFQKIALFRNKSESRKRFFCSEIIDLAYRKCLNIILWPSAHPSNITPWDIFRSKLLENLMIYRKI